MAKEATNKAEKGVDKAKSMGEEAKDKVHMMKEKVDKHS
jgi:hypothetical protein